MVLPAHGFGKSRSLARLFVLLGDAAEECLILYVGPVSLRTLAADAEIENRLDFTPRNPQIFEARAEKCHRRHMSGQRVLGRNLGKREIGSDHVVDVEAADDGGRQRDHAVAGFCASGAGDVHIGRLERNAIARVVAVEELGAEAAAVRQPDESLITGAGGERVERRPGERRRERGKGGCG